MEQLFRISVLLCVLGTGLCLECYTCIRQDNNKDKCIKTTIQCEEYEDTCYSRIRWGIPPYWTPHGDRIHFLNKGCIGQDACRQWQARQRNTCRRDWYLDWECIECCSGDLCNYYVTLGAPRLHQVSFISIFLCLASSTFLYTWLVGS